MSIKRLAGMQIRPQTSTGNVQAAQVLAGYTFSNDNDVDQVGTMTNRSGSFNAAGWANPNNDSGVDVLVPQGYYDGATSVWTSDGDLAPGNIKPGVNIFGVTGNFTNDAVLDPYWLTEGSSGYDDGVLKWGTSPRRGAYTNCASWADGGNGIIYVRIPEGTYRDKSGSGYPEIQINDAWLKWTGDVENDDTRVQSGYRYWAFGVKRTGTMPWRGWQDISPQTWDQYFGWGHYNDGNNNNGFVVRARGSYFSQSRGSSTSDGSGFIEATGLGYTPYYIVIMRSGITNPFNQPLHAFYLPNWTSGQYHVNGSMVNFSDHPGCYVNSNGFRLWIGSYGSNHEWGATGSY